ncbi:hypothetical protein HUG15_08925 [Salicibibacter cibarius]|uniref:Uncharacterized protein n=1 Tax=Salicibibacter cibarius TaxID=2743000 RepID=A0A7T6Z2D1_9BACI|nr:hypothetical protein [Salicibibacter cibarius]QQK75676.1 hypothetical protein HUG15_08925 [Salicibibacter cibarius]
MVHCPNCLLKDLGKIGTAQYYCGRCGIEIVIQGEHLAVFQVEEDGSLSSLDDLFSDEERRINTEASPQLIQKASGR